MRPLDRKLLRELWQIRAQVLAIALVLGSGIAGYVSLASTWASLEEARQTFYARTRFADVFATLVRAPRSVAEQVAALPGVQEAEPRIVAAVRILVPDFDEPVNGIAISLPAWGRPPIDDLHLRDGSWIDPERSDEVLIHEAFALAHGLEPGDEIRAVMNGRMERLRIAGIVLSPEYVYLVTPGTLFPDDQRNGVLWASERTLERAFDMDGAFNDLVVRLARGASEATAIEEIDRILEPWGGTGARPRADQLSNNMLQQELDGLRVQAILVPLLFLGVAAFLLQLVVGRIVAGQREAIAVLKALGLSDRAIGLHYLKLVAAICAGGSLAGALLGIAFGRSMIEMYRPFFRFPVLVFRLQPDVLAIGVLVGVLAGLVATFGSVRKVVRLPPAEAMRPPVPASYRPTLVERIGFGRFLSPAARMVARRLERRPIKTALSTLGVALSLSLLVATYSLLGSVDLLVDLAFRLEQRQDATVTFVEPRAERAIFEVRRLPGVLDAEPIRYVAARLHAGHRKEDVGLQGLPDGARLRRILADGARPVALPPEGLLLSRVLGEKLGVREGDRLFVEVLEGERPKVEVPVGALVDDWLGLNAYMELEPLHRLLGEGRRISGALVQLDPTRERELLDALIQTPLVAGTQLRSAAIRVFDRTMEETQGVTNFILALFASIISVGVVYNTARILLAESSRELASLRVLGFTRGEISRIFLGELATIVLAALPLGTGLGWLLARAIVASLPAEVYRLPVRLPPADLLGSIAVILAAAAASALVVRRRLDRLDLIAVLKTRE